MAHPKVIATYIVNWNDGGYFELCKVYSVEDGTYYREYDTGSRTIITAITEKMFFKQMQNTLAGNM